MSEKASSCVMRATGDEAKPTMYLFWGMQHNLEFTYFDALTT